MNTLLWVIQIILSLLFMFAGVSKFLTPAEEMAQNMPAFLSIGFIYFIGACEIIGSLGLILPWAKTDAACRYTALHHYDRRRHCICDWIAGNGDLSCDNCVIVRICRVGP